MRIKVNSLQQLTLQVKQGPGQAKTMGMHKSAKLERGTNITICDHRCSQCVELCQTGAPKARCIGQHGRHGHNCSSSKHSHLRPGDSKGHFVGQHDAMHHEGTANMRCVALVALTPCS